MVGDDFPGPDSGFSIQKSVKIRTTLLLAGSGYDRVIFKPNSYFAISGFNVERKNLNFSVKSVSITSRRIFRVYRGV